MPTDQANAARIVACVNHCKGATNEELEAVSHEQLKAQRDELLAALREAEQYLCDAEGEPIRAILGKYETPPQP